MSCVPDVSPAPVGQQGTSHARRCVDSWGSLRAGVRNRYSPHYKLHDAAAGAEALLGVSLLAQDDLDECGGVRADLGGLAHDARKRPVGIAPMARGPVLGQGGVPAVRGTAPVHCDARTAMEHLHGADGVAGPQLLAHQRVRHRVVVPLDLHVVVDAGATLLPLTEHIVRGWKRLELGALDFLKQRSATCSEVARDAVVDPLDAVANGGIELGKREERTFTELGDNPSQRDLYSNLLPGQLQCRNGTPSPDTCD